MNIVTIFSGRKPNLEVLVKYLEKALELNIIHEVHFWNNTRNTHDEEYIKTISNLKRTSSTGQGNYVVITPVISNNSFELNVRASNDIHIKISDLVMQYEIVLGGWGNTKSVVRATKNNIEVFSLIQHGIADGNNYNNFKVKIEDNMLNIIKNNELIISQKILKNFEIMNVFFKTGHNSVGDLIYNTTQNKGFYFMDTCEKSWRNYYNYYVDKKYENDVIIKCDDDIVFIDLFKLPKFIDFVKNNECDLVFANTINNGVSAYFQQNKYNLIPKELMDLEYPEYGWYGSLWGSGVKAELLHMYFIENYKKFIDYEYNNENIQIETRYSINFFGYKGKNWHKITNCFVDDEYMLTIDYVHNCNFKNILYTDCYVSHLSFYRQNETGIDLNKLIDKYNKLYYTMEENGRFTLEKDVSD